MQTEFLIAIDEFCAHHNVEVSFIHTLHQNGLIEITFVQESAFIDKDQLPELEKIIHLYFELNINIEGIDTISHLLKRIDSMQRELIALRNRLQLYENMAYPD